MGPYSLPVLLQPGTRIMDNNHHVYGSEPVVLYTDIPRMLALFIGDGSPVFEMLMIFTDGDVLMTYGSVN